jgi:DNA polymerase elongation subunit (family B)
MGMCHICHVSYENYFFSSKYLEGAILTYLRRQNRVSPNKPKLAPKDDDDDGEKGFTGAYVKDPIVGRHNWVFSVDINSLYPSAIRSLNVSPETKRGKIMNWGEIRDQETPTPIAKWNDVEVVISDGSRREMNIPMDDFKAMLVEKNFSVSSAGIIYSQEKQGIIPEILEVWYNERKQFKNKAYEAGKAGDKETESFYDKRQHVQKILLNSLYGVLGLPVFRFYDIDNAESTTLTGQDIIKSTGMYTTHLYKQILGELDAEADKDDYVVYTDTDSCYMSLDDIVKAKGFNLDVRDIQDTDERIPYLVDVSHRFETQINEFYDVVCKQFFNVGKGDHCIQIGCETLATAAFWVAKKRYAYYKVWDLEKNKPKYGEDGKFGKVEVTGLDVVRSSFPTKFQEVMKAVLKDILTYAEKSDVDEKILTLKKEIPTLPVDEIARNTSIKNIKKYEKHCKKLVMGQFPKVKQSKETDRLLSYTAHAKAAINFNKFLTHHGVDKDIEPIKNGEKIKYVYLKKNEFGLEEIAFRGYKDPDVIMDYIEKYCDGLGLFDKELKNKLLDFYNALGWDFPSESDKIVDDFFEF